MTDYLTLEDVYPLIGAVGYLSDGDPGADPPVPATVLTASAAGVLISQVCAEIDGHLRMAGVDVPPADDGVLDSLKAIAQSGVAARILMSLFPDKAGAPGEKGSAATHQANYEAGLALIDQGAVGAVKRSGSFSHGFLTAEELAEQGDPF